MDASTASVQEGMEQFKCEICDTKFKSKKGMKVHIATIHEGKKQFKCDLCGANFGQNSTLNTHIASVHTEGLFSSGLPFWPI